MAGKIDPKGGMWLVASEFWSPVPAVGEHLDMPVLMQSMQGAEKLILCHRQDCFWTDIGRPEDFAEAQSMIERDPRAFMPRTPADS